MDATLTPSRRRGLVRQVGAVGACTAVAATLGIGTASASPGTTTVTHAAVRIVDDEHGLLLFVNKSRADLCTPERIAYEALIIEWFESGALGDPPPEPAGTTEGEAEVTLTTRMVGGRELTTLEGDDVPVEVWRLDGEEGGIDCTATDGPGAGLFASGPMDLTVRRNVSDAVQTGNLKAEGVVVAPEGTRWNISVSYLVTIAGEMESLQGVTRLVELG